MATIDEIADAALFLCSDASASSPASRSSSTAGCGCGRVTRSGRTRVQQLLLFDTGSTELPGEPAAVIADSEAWWRAVTPRAPSGIDPPHSSPDSPGQPPRPALAASAVVFVRHPRARRYLIRVRTDGSVASRFPSRLEARGGCLLRAAAAWIARQQERSRRSGRRCRDLPEEEQRLPRRAGGNCLARLLELAAIAGVAVRKVSVRNQRQRWGSCSPSGLICLNWRLITMPGWVRDYVLYHELMHLKRMDHSPAFWNSSRRCVPGFAMRDAGCAGTRSRRTRRKRTLTPIVQT